MKSAFELAMERLGGGLREFTEEQKERLAEVDRVYDAKAAQARLNADQRRAEAAGNREIVGQVQDDLATEIASIESKREREKERLRGEFGEGN